MTTWVTPNIGFQGLHDPFPPDATVVEAMDLADGWNTPEAIFLKCKLILSHLLRRRKVVVFCHAGLSRSPGLVITCLAWCHNVDWDRMHFWVKEEARQVQISLDFADACKEGLKLLYERLVKYCKCGAPLEKSEELCDECWQKEHP